MIDLDNSNYWNWATVNNCQVPQLCLRTDTSLVSFLPANIKNKIRKFMRFASYQSEQLANTRNMPLEWARLCDMQSKQSFKYAPRWTAPIFYFRSPFISLFNGKSGLDVGARVNTLGSVLKRDFSCFGQEKAFLIDSLIPHFKYYSQLGSIMKAIDLLAPDPEYFEIEKGDARCLSFPSKTFSFITIPMLLGNGNPCSSYLEIALCLCELKRVLQPGGFIYIADAGFQPTVGFAAQCIDLDVFISKGDIEGIPLGIVLRKRQLVKVSDLFEDIFVRILNYKVVFHKTHDEVILNCNLLWDKDHVLVSIKI